MTWSEKEVLAYEPVNNHLLDGVYSDSGIPPTNPEERTRYLAEEVLELGRTDYDLIMRTAKEEGRHVALNLLEEMAITRFHSIC